MFSNQLKARRKETNVNDFNGVDFKMVDKFCLKISSFMLFVHVRHRSVYFFVNVTVLLGRGLNYTLPILLINEVLDQKVLWEPYIRLTCRSFYIQILSDIQPKTLEIQRPFHQRNAISFSNMDEELQYISLITDSCKFRLSKMTYSIKRPT